MRSSLVAVPVFASLTLAVVFPVIHPTAAYAADTLFFAEDLNRNGDAVRVVPVNSIAKRDAFLAALVGAVTETFESQAAATQPWTLAFGTASTVGTLTGTGPNTTMVSFPSPTGTVGGRFPFSGSVFFQQADEFEPDRYSAVLVLNAPQRAFGFFASDWGDSGFLQGTRPTVRVTYADNNTTALFEAPASILGTDISGSAAFFGVMTDRAFNRVEIVNGTGSRTTGYDNFIVASQLVVAPEPGSVPLLLSGLIAGPVFGLVRRRRHIS